MVHANDSSRNYGSRNMGCNIISVHSTSNKRKLNTMKKLLIIAGLFLTGCEQKIKGKYITSQTDAQIEIMYRLDSINNNLENIAKSLDKLSNK
jgi:hypothetical protein